MRSYLMLDLLPWENSTRPRKIASILKDHGDVTYVSLAAAGRTGMRSKSGRREVDGVSVVGVGMHSLRAGRGLGSSLLNLLAYLAGFVRLMRVSAKLRADVIFCSSPALLPWATLVAGARRVPLIFDGRERPASIRSEGSLATWVARLEPMIYWFVARRCFGVIAAAPTHAQEYGRWGFRRTHVLFNVPNFQRSGATRTEVALRGPLTVGLLGSLYPGRGVLELVEGVAEARHRGADVRLRIAGFGSSEFVQTMLDSAQRIEGDAAFEFVGPLRYEDVPDFYATIDIGAVLYSASDRAQDSLPNKLFECLSAGRGVLASTLPETCALVKLLDVGLCVDVQGHAVAEALVDLSGPSRLRVRAFSLAASTACDERFSWDVQCRELERFLAPVLS